MNITLNGSARDVEAGTTIGKVVDLVTSDRQRIAVERNLAIVKREQYDDTTIEEGDVIEVVTLVGGG